MKNTEKKCPECGETFLCCQENSCWCGEFYLTPDTLCELRGKFEDCLCQTCLKNHSEEGKL